jgi:hypothetical protein
MQVKCGKCGATINITVSSLHPLRWGTSDFPNIEHLCLEWRDPANVVARASHTCQSLEKTVAEAVGAG